MSVLSVYASGVQYLPPGYGDLHTYTVWDEIRWGGDCRELIDYVSNYDLVSNNHGIVTYGDYFCGALTSTYGKVGDMLLVVQENDIVYPVIMADTKNQSDDGCNKWGHQNGRCVVEFEILSSHKESLYSGSGGYISDILAKPVVKVINLGSVYDDSKYLSNVRQACIDNGLENYKLIVSPYDYVIIESVTTEFSSELSELHPSNIKSNNFFYMIFSWFYNIF